MIAQCPHLRLIDRLRDSWGGLRGKRWAGKQCGSHRRNPDPPPHSPEAHAAAASGQQTNRRNRGEQPNRNQLNSDHSDFSQVVRIRNNVLFATVKRRGIESRRLDHGPPAEIVAVVTPLEAGAIPRALPVAVTEARNSPKTRQSR
jgi:hypothetical protein